MPAIRWCWRHIIVNTRNTWFHGDNRGFRDRHHRVHSSGDYKNPPPEGEHAGLYDYFAERAGPEVVFERDVRPVIGRALVASPRSMTYEPACIAIGKVHAHFLVRLADDYGLVKRVAGNAKHDASCAVSATLPGEVWAAGGTFRKVKDESHRRNVYGYILFDQGPEAWTWCPEDKSEEGRFGRHKSGRR